MYIIPTFIKYFFYHLETVGFSWDSNLLENPLEGLSWLNIIHFKNDHFQTSLRVIWDILIHIDNNIMITQVEVFIILYCIYIQYYITIHRMFSSVSKTRQ